MLPADEGLETDDVPGGKLEDRLVVDPQFLVADRVLERRSEQGTLDDRFLQCRLVEPDGRLACALGGVQGQVRLSEHRVGAPCVIAGHGNADAHLRGDLLPIQEERGVEGVEDPLGQGDRICCIGPGEFDANGVLVAPESGGGVLIA